MNGQVNMISCRLSEQHLQDRSDRNEHVNVVSHVNDYQNNTYRTGATIMDMLSCHITHYHTPIQQTKAVVYNMMCLTRTLGILHCNIIISNYNHFSKQEFPITIRTACRDFAVTTTDGSRGFRIANA